MTPSPFPLIRNQPTGSVASAAPPPSSAGLRRGSPEGPPEGHEAGPDWHRIASALLRFKWVVILAVLLGLGGAFAAPRVLRPVYRAQANGWGAGPERRGENPSDARGPIRQGALPDAAAR